MIIINKAIASLAILIASGRDVAAADVAKGIAPTLKGAASKLDARYDTKHPQLPVEDDTVQGVLNGDGPRMTKVITTSSADITATNSGYKYRLQINAATPPGDHTVDECVEWPKDSNGANFTWYGLRIQLSDDAKTKGGRWYPDVTRSTKELGIVQKYNMTSPPLTLLEFNITTPETQPIIRMNWNDDPFYETFKFDFVDTGSDTSITDGSSYQEFTKENRGSIWCYGDPPGDWRRVFNPVIPTLTISMQKFSDEGGNTSPPPSPVGPPPNAAFLATPHGKILSICSLAIIAGMGTVFS